LDKQFLLKISARGVDGKRRTGHLLFVGKPEEARAAAQKKYNGIRQSGGTDVRVEIWQIVNMAYKGTIGR
jgi:hypothetical protein